MKILDGLLLFLLLSINVTCQIQSDHIDQYLQQHQSTNYFKNGNVDDSNPSGTSSNKEDPSQHQNHRDSSDDQSSASRKGEHKSGKTNKNGIHKTFRTQLQSQANSEENAEPLAQVILGQNSEQESPKTIKLSFIFVGFSVLFLIVWKTAMSQGILGCIRNTMDYCVIRHFRNLFKNPSKGYSPTIVFEVSQDENPQYFSSDDASFSHSPLWKSSNHDLI